MYHLSHHNIMTGFFMKAQFPILAIPPPPRDPDSGKKKSPFWSLGHYKYNINSEDTFCGIECCVGGKASGRQIFLH